MDGSGWEPDGVTLQVRFCEGGREYRVTGIPAATLQRAIGTIRRECLDWLIPMSELHLRLVLKVWVTHYNGAHLHMALGPGVPDPPLPTVRASTQLSGHQIGGRLVLRVKSILAGLHHEYSLAPALG